MTLKRKGEIMKKSGILMPLFSLPSKSGIGEMGSFTIEFLDILKENGIKIWQILPLNPVGYGNSPYQPYSSFAGDEIYISLDELLKEGLLKDCPPSFLEKSTKVEYEKIREFKEPFLRKAFENFEKTKDYDIFINQKWVYEYAVFRAFKKENKNKCWNEWKDFEKSWADNKSPLPEKIKNEADYHMFLQYIFFKQWMKIKKEASKRDISIMGDIPFYVGIDSVDVWTGKENFLLDKNGKPIFIAGVPPDYFSKTGQRWGNPIYNWEFLKKNNYDFWVDRIGYSQKLFDIIRIDHFRAFDTYWEIPSDCPTAINGNWIEAPGYEVIDTLIKKIPDINLVAEDLGDLRPEVIKLKEHYNLKGMKVLIFSIEIGEKSAFDNFKDRENMIIYTGTHDNDTLMEWYEKLSCDSRSKVISFLTEKGFTQGSVNYRLISYALNSNAEFAVIHMGDILGLGKEAHINTPGTIGAPNWQWRISDINKISENLKKYKQLFISRK